MNTLSQSGPIRTFRSLDLLAGLRVANNVCVVPQKRPLKNGVLERSHAHRLRHLHQSDVIDALLFIETVECAKNYKSCILLIAEHVREDGKNSMIVAITTEFPAVSNYSNNTKMLKVW
jgi:ABC-type branched-subunit amino acid transport system ATPase component